MNVGEDTPCHVDHWLDMRCSFEEMKPLLLPFDKGAVFTRRMLADQIAGKKHLLPTSTRIAAADV